MSTPDRHNMPWSPPEESRLLNLIRRGKTHDEIASDLKRTVASIRARCIYVACRAVEPPSNWTTLDAASHTGLSTEDVEAALKLRKPADVGKRWSADVPVIEEAKKMTYEDRVLEEAKKRVAAEQEAEEARLFEADVVAAMSKLRPPPPRIINGRVAAPESDKVNIIAC